MPTDPAPIIDSDQLPTKRPLTPSEAQRVLDQVVMYYMPYGTDKNAAFRAISCLSLRVRRLEAGL